MTSGDSNLSSLLPSHLPFAQALKTKIALGFSLLVVLSLSAFYFLSISEVSNSLQQQTRSLGLALASQSASAVREPVLANDLLSLEVVLDQITKNRDIISISVFDIDDQLIAQSENSSADAIEGKTVYQAPITLQDAIAGSVTLRINTATQAKSFERIQMYFWLSLIVSLLIAIISAWYLSAYITVPLSAISNAFKNPQESDLDFLITNSGELMQFQEDCSTFLQDYQRLLLEQQSLSNIPLTNEDTPLERPLKILSSVFIIKVVNVNTAIELLHASTLSRLLSEYLFYLRQAAKLYGGTLQRFTGDSVLVAFDTRSSTDDFSFNAVCCAQLFQRIMSAVAAKHRAEKSQALEFKLAIHSGESFLSANEEDTQDNPQSIQCEALIGKVIETAYLLNRQAKAGQLIISENTYSQAGGESKFSNEESIEVTMPSDNMSFMAYVVTNINPDDDERLESQATHILSLAPKI